MTKAFKNVILPAIISLIITAPFFILELRNTKNFSSDNFPFPLFIFMWLLALVFILSLVLLVRKIKTRQLNFLSALIVIPIMVFAAWAYVNIIVDQMPCFLGYPNCD